jgi:hypothetical protein
MLAKSADIWLSGQHVVDIPSQAIHTVDVAARAPRPQLPAPHPASRAESRREGRVEAPGKVTTNRTRGVQQKVEV